MNFRRYSAHPVDSYPESAVANFFTPASQKPKDRTTWPERSPDESTPATLLVGKYIPENEEGTKWERQEERRKIAAFDFVSDRKEMNGIVWKRIIFLTWRRTQLSSQRLLASDMPATRLIENGGIILFPRG